MDGFGLFPACRYLLLTFFCFLFQVYLFILFKSAKPGLVPDIVIWKKKNQNETDKEPSPFVSYFVSMSYS